jgi:hypothetical protein
MYSLSTCSSFSLVGWSCLELLQPHPFKEGLRLPFHQRSPASKLKSGPNFSIISTVAHRGSDYTGNYSMTATSNACNLLARR